MRPEPPGWPIPAGLRWVVHPDDGWRLATAAEAAVRRCRHSTRTPCDQPPVAALARRRRRYSEPMDLDGTVVWWFYCADHMYDRWVEDGRVVWWTLRPVEVGA